MLQIKQDTLMKAMKALNFISGGSITEEDIRRHRASMERAGKLTAPRANISTASFSAGGISCEAITPEFAHNPNYAVLHMHGGGYLYGGLSYARILAAKIAIATGFSTYTFDYALSPENQYPAALDDAVSVWEYLLEQYAPDHILLSGESAGGNLALCLAQKLLEEGRELPALLLLFSPWTDMTATAKTYETHKDTDPILTIDYIKHAAAAYIGANGTPDDPRFSPLFGRISGLPPAYIMAGRNEILLDDSVRLYESILAAGGRASLDIEENGWHVYQQMPIRIAGRAMKRAAAYVSEEIYRNDTGK